MGEKERIANEDGEERSWRRWREEVSSFESGGETRSSFGGVLGEVLGVGSSLEETVVWRTVVVGSVRR
jgi:hypothetical protein